mmetsp:Transcript_5145/g.14449  ORF Transcript_5145/g.14449 Transcript_5145/m.14449 type:complete len:213 (+) Transcript_5145:2773-3411(+)
MAFTHSKNGPEDSKMEWSKPAPRTRACIASAAARSTCPIVSCTAWRNCSRSASVLTFCSASSSAFCSVCFCARLGDPTPTNLAKNPNSSRRRSAGKCWSYFFRLVANALCATRPTSVNNDSFRLSKSELMQCDGESPCSARNPYASCTYDTKPCRSSSFPANAAPSRSCPHARYTYATSTRNPSFLLPTFFVFPISCRNGTIAKNKAVTIDS